MFFDEFCEIFRTPFLQNTSRWLILFYEKIKQVETVGKENNNARRVLYSKP